MNAGEREPTTDEKAWAMWAHLGALCGYVVPLGHLALPLIVGALKRSAYVRHHAREAFNFQLSVSLAIMAGAAVWLSVAESVYGIRLGEQPGSLPGYAWVVVGVGSGMLFFLQPLVWVVDGALRARDGVWYRYPLAMRVWKGPEAPPQG